MPRKKTAPEQSFFPRPTPAELEQVLRQLAGDMRFQLYVEQLRDMRETAIRDLCNDEVVGSHAKLAAAVGEIRAYTDILGLTENHIEAVGPVSDEQIP